MSEAKVYVDGSVYSPVDPYATALVAKDGEVMWVGSDAGAESILDSSMQKVELEGNLLTPSFIQGFQTLQNLEEAETALRNLAEKGFGGAVFASSNPDLPSLVSSSLTLTWLYHTTERADLPPGFDGFYWAKKELEEEDFNALIKSPAKILSFSGAHADSILQYLAHHEHAALPILRLENFSCWDSQERLASLAQHQIFIGIKVGESSNDFPFSRLANSAVPYYLYADALKKSELLGWETVRYGIERHGMSARSAFNSLTKGAARALAKHPFLGQLVPGAPAHISRWKVEELMVQTADSRVANWSTDPRARIPLLPVLEEGSEPVLIETF